MKLNMDGSFRGKMGRAECGGLIRNKRAECVKGFHGRLSNCPTLEAELWTVHGGLNLAMQEGINSIEIESNSQGVVEIINK